MHDRLHAGSTRLRSQSTITADAPHSLAQARYDKCAACTEVNATRHLYDFTGRLVHADIASPNLRTHHQSTKFHYLFVLVDGVN
eukprot:385886-Pleurochrysis_carterae.AAC.1